MRQSFFRFTNTTIFFDIFLKKSQTNEKMESDFEKNLKSLKKKLSLYRQEIDVE